MAISTPTPTNTASPAAIKLKTPPQTKILQGGTHAFETFNNCGPATLSMALSYSGVKVTQQELGQALRPYQHPKGDNDDKSTTLEELAEKSKEYGHIPFFRPMGNPEIIKLFVSYDIPVMARTLTKPTEDIAHYRLVKGYDDVAREFTQDDSLQGKDLKYTYEAFDALWGSLGYEFLVVVPKDKEAIARAILGKNADSNTAWSQAVEFFNSKLAQNSNDVQARFNLSVAYHKVGDYQRSVEEFEKVENKLSFRTLWYQIEPIESYFQLGDYARVFQITDKILNNNNRAFSELYLLRGEIYKKQGKTALARSEFEKAVLYNKSLKAAQDALNSL